MKLTDQLQNSTNRVKALENDRIKNQFSVTRITKVFGDVVVEIEVTARTHQYLICGEPNAICGGQNAVL
jgi:hypothetical protein